MTASLSRRAFVYTGLFGAGAVGLHSLATGLPRSLLADPLGTVARAEEPPPSRVLILSASRAGDPTNANVPGTYLPHLEDVLHPQTEEMTPTPLRLGDGVEWIAARPWAELPEDVLEETVFFHHGTYTNTHPNHAKVMGLMGHIERGEMLVSLLAKTLGPALGTTQIEPVSLGARSAGELLSFEGRTLSNVTPLALRQVLGSPRGPLGELQQIRDRTLDEIYGILRAEGSIRQRRMLERFAHSRDEARNVSETLLGELDAIEGDDVTNQVRAAPILAAMNISPVITINIPFGGDNHRDRGLERESRETVSGVAHLSSLVRRSRELRALGALRSEVVVANLNVFGRTMNRLRKGDRGRDHNSRHHCAVLIGPPLQGQVVGGIERFGPSGRPDRQDFAATPIDATTGASDPAGDVPADETFQSMAKTLGVALGVAESTLDQNIRGGRIVRSAIRSSTIVGDPG